MSILLFVLCTVYAFVRFIKTHFVQFHTSVVYTVNNLELYEEYVCVSAFIGVVIAALYPQVTTSAHGEILFWERDIELVSEIWENSSFSLNFNIFSIGMRWGRLLRNLLIFDWMVDF